MWYGKYVDFGDFDTSVNSSITKNKVIYFDFEVDLEVTPPSNIYDAYNKNNVFFDFDAAPLTIPIKIVLGVNSVSKNTQACYFSLETEDCVIQVELSGYKVSSFKSYAKRSGCEIVSNVEMLAIGSGFLPIIMEKEAEDSDEIFSSNEQAPSDIKSYLIEYIASFHHKHKSVDGVREVVSRMPMKYKDELFSWLLEQFERDRQFSKNVESLKQDFIDNVYLHVLSMNINVISKSVNVALKNFFTGVRYLGPVRATAERFYRYQDLRVNEIDHMGSNLPMVINSLPEYKRKQLERWMLEHFDFSLVLESAGSHYALKIKDSSMDKAYNISDMGFGYSQLLPIVVSIWIEMQPNRSLFGKKRGTDQIVVIEQPELHLHPEMQYKFAEAIAKIASLSSGQKIRFIFETHSKHIIDAFGQAIRDDLIKSDDVNIAIFEKQDDNLTKVSASGFDEDGYLVNWPVGFLSA